MTAAITPGRWLRLTSPHLHGTDVERLQQSLVVRAKNRGLHVIDVDGDYGKETADAVEEVLRDLGAPLDKLDVGATTQLQKYIIDPSKCPKTWLKTAEARDKVAKAANKGKAGFLKYLRDHVGKVESPKDSNHGPWLEPIMREAGWNVPFSQKGPPYCGIGQLVGLRRSGLNVPNSWAYTPNILNDARAGRYGFKVVGIDDRQPGDLLLMDFGYSRDPVEHVGAVEDSDSTIEFNTSAGSSGNQQNGGGCYRRDFAERRAAVVACVRPPWSRAA